ncbi:MAG: aminotransferase class V-fold PLP-dependent enzyme [Nocardioidaceae bacterium]
MHYLSERATEAYEGSRAKVQGFLNAAHSNIVPWQMICTERGVRLRVAPIDDAGELVRSTSSTLS